MDQVTHLSTYMNNGIKRIVKNIYKASYKSPKEITFITRFMLSAKKAEQIRTEYERKNQHIPPFLIGSITSQCNLFCSGCYARANQSCHEGNINHLMHANRWGELFEEAKQLGINFILLAGGEPLMRLDVLKEAARHREIIFPVFTNGTLLTDDALKLFDQNRNLIPIISIEGNKEQTDARRGIGTYDHIVSIMSTLNKRGIIFAVSVTVTTENIDTVTSEIYFKELYKTGCHGAVFVEYVPISEGTDALILTDEERVYLEMRQESLRQRFEDAIFVSFPGDEKYSGGCLAAGRGFFHIGVDGSAEPCPFSNYSAVNMNEVSILEAVNSKFFEDLRKSGLLQEEHEGGCTLFKKEVEVKELLNATPLNV